MRTDTFTWEGITCSITSPMRRQAIDEATYKRAIRRAYPEILEYEKSTLIVPLPQPPLVEGLPEAEQSRLKSLHQEKMATHRAKLMVIALEQPVGAAQSRAMNDVAYLLSRIPQIDGAVFSRGVDGVFPDDQVVLAMRDWLESERRPDKPEDSFWTYLIRRIEEFDAPLTDVSMKPPEHLTEAEKDDPLSSPDVE